MKYALLLLFVLFIYSADAQKSAVVTDSVFLYKVMPDPIEVISSGLPCDGCHVVFPSHHTNCDNESAGEDYKPYKGNLRMTGRHTSDDIHYTGDYMISDYYYTYINGKYDENVETHEIVTTYDEATKQIITTTKKRVNGKLLATYVEKERARWSQY